METNEIQLFEDQKIRTAWDAEQEEWYFSIVDVIAVLTEQPDTRHAAKYWSVLKNRLKKEGSELPTLCSQLKLRSADGKRYLTDVATTEQLFRLIQSVPSPKSVQRQLKKIRNKGIFFITLRQKGAVAHPLKKKDRSKSQKRLYNFGLLL